MSKSLQREIKTLIAPVSGNKPLLCHLSMRLDKDKGLFI
jgi:hypothetical protein